MLLVEILEEKSFGRERKTDSMRDNLIPKILVLSVYIYDLILLLNLSLLAAQGQDFRPSRRDNPSVRKLILIH